MINEDKRRFMRMTVEAVATITELEKAGNNIKAFAKI